MSDDIDSGRTRAAGRREHVNMPLPHMVAKGKVGFMSASVTTTMTTNSHIKCELIIMAFRVYVQCC